MEIGEEIECCSGQAPFYNLEQKRSHSYECILRHAWAQSDYDISSHELLEEGTDQKADLPLEWLVGETQESKRTE